jgi:hypothetical protein
MDDVGEVKKPRMTVPKESVVTDEISASPLLSGGITGP